MFAANAKGFVGVFRTQNGVPDSRQHVCIELQEELDVVNEEDCLRTRHHVILPFLSDESKRSTLRGETKPYTKNFPAWQV